MTVLTRAQLEQWGDIACHSLTSSHEPVGNKPQEKPNSLPTLTPSAPFQKMGHNPLEETRCLQQTRCNGKRVCGSRPADAGGVQPRLVDSRHSPVLLVGDVAQHHGLAEAMDSVAQGSSMPQEVVVLDALAGTGGLLQLVGCHAGKAAQQALPLLTQLAGQHVQNAPETLQRGRGLRDSLQCNYSISIVYKEGEQTYREDTENVESAACRARRVKPRLSATQWQPKLQNFCNAAIPKCTWKM